MQLSKFLKKSGLTWEQFADKAGVSRQTIYHLMQKKHNSTLKTIDKVIKASNNEITIEDLRI